jgi:hypothetical protein
MLEANFTCVAKDLTLPLRSRELWHELPGPRR